MDHHLTLDLVKSVKSVKIILYHLSYTLEVVACFQSYLLLYCHDINDKISFYPHTRAYIIYFFKWGLRTKISTNATFTILENVGKKNPLPRSASKSKSHIATKFHLYLYVSLVWYPEDNLTITDETITSLAEVIIYREITQMIIHNKQTYTLPCGSQNKFCVLSQSPQILWQMISG